MEFRTFLEQDQHSARPWKAKRADVISMWEKLQANLPIAIKPVRLGFRGSKFRQDGIRVTGSPQFITSVISRIKDLLVYETKSDTKLEVEFRQIESKDGDPTPQYVFYIHVVYEEP